MSDEAEREIVLSRRIGGPRELVFAVYTDPKHLERWFGPDGFRTTTRAFELRPGGAWDFTMHGPDGVDYPNWIEWREIVPPERLVYLQGERKDDPNAFVGTVTFVEKPGGTEITLRALFPTKALRDFAIERYGVIEGGRQHLGRLDAYVKAMKGR